MGLHMSHGCWDGAYSAFHRFRTLIAMFAGLPPLDRMEGFCDASWAISWKSLEPDVLHELLNHSDCEGEINWECCDLLADRLEDVKGNVDERVKSFECGQMPNFVECIDEMIEGLRYAYQKQENIEFG